MPEITGDEIKAFRERWGLSYRELGALIGYDHALIWRWERPEEERRIPGRVRILLDAVERELRDRPAGEDGKST